MFHVAVPLLKPLLGGQPPPLGVAPKTTVQRWDCTSISGGLTKENKVAEVVEHIGMAAEIMEPPCSPTQGAPELDPHQPDGA